VARVWSPRRFWSLRALTLTLAAPHSPSTAVMWCTRWYLPLLFLPFPHASPFFLIVFLFSLTLHARPCLYCILLLVALFTSSCYWEPIPMSTLSIPPSALNLTYPEPPSVDYSSSTLIRLVDRCWCDFGLTPFFDPFNNTRWEEVSLERDSKRRSAISLQNDAQAAVASDQVNATESEDSDSQTGHFWHSLLRRPRWPFAAPKPSYATGASMGRGLESQSRSPLRFLRRKYDLRHIGIGVTVDFGWGRSQE